jgi:hypothetical protein
MLRVPASFVDQTLWPEFVELNKTLQEYLRATTERIIKESVYQTLLKRGCQIAPGDSKVDSDRFGIRIAIKGTKGYFW